MRKINPPIISEEEQRLAWPFGTIDQGRWRAEAEVKARALLETIPVGYRNWSRHLIIGSKEITDAGARVVREYVKEMRQESLRLFVTGSNGKTNQAVAKEAEEAKNSPCLIISPEMTRPDITDIRRDDYTIGAQAADANRKRLNQATQEAELVCLALADHITIFQYAHSSGASSLITSARAVFGKEALKIELTV